MNNNSQNRAAAGEVMNFGCEVHKSGRGGVRKNAGRKKGDDTQSINDTIKNESR